MKKSKYMVLVIFILSCCLSFLLIKETITGQAAQQTVSITEYFNNGIFGSGYDKACGGAVVTISNIEEMRIFLNCLYSYKWTSGISFRQERDISFGNCTFDYEPDSNKVLFNREGSRLEHDGFFLGITDIRLLGLEDMCVEIKTGRAFWGQYDGQGYSISNFILSTDSAVESVFFWRGKRGGMYS